MPKYVTSFQLPVPVLTDSVNIPTDMENLAVSVGAHLGTAFNQIEQGGWEDGAVTFPNNPLVSGTPTYPAHVWGNYTSGSNVLFKTAARRMGTVVTLTGLVKVSGTAVISPSHPSQVMTLPWLADRTCVWSGMSNVGHVRLDIAQDTGTLLVYAMPWETDMTIPTGGWLNFTGHYICKATAVMSEAQRNAQALPEGPYQPDVLLTP